MAAQSLLDRVGRQTKNPDTVASLYAEFVTGPEEVDWFEFDRRMAAALTVLEALAPETAPAWPEIVSRLSDGLLLIAGVVLVWSGIQQRNASVPLLVAGAMLLGAPTFLRHRETEPK